MHAEDSVFSTLFVPLVLDDAIRAYVNLNGHTVTATYRTMAGKGLESFASVDDAIAYGRALPLKLDAVQIVRSLSLPHDLRNRLRNIALYSRRSQTVLFCHLVSLGLHLSGEQPPLPLASQLNAA